MRLVVLPSLNIVRALQKKKEALMIFCHAALALLSGMNGSQQVVLSKKLYSNKETSV